MNNKPSILRRTRDRFFNLQSSIFLLLAGFILATISPQLAAQSTNRAALVVSLGGGNVQTRCVEFSEPQITGYDLLLRSGLEPVVDVQGGGALVCRIDGVGCPAENCLCQCSGGGDCIYWSYWHQIGGSWQYSQAGASMYPITDGMVDGWSWGPGSANQAVPPPDIAFSDVCQVPATETPTAVPPSATPPPTATPSPEISFTVDANSVSAGACTHLRWRVENITAVYLNGVGVVGDGTQEVCPSTTETYALKVVYPAGEETRSLTVTVLDAPATPTPTPLAPAAVPATAPPLSATTAPTAVPPTLDAAIPAAGDTAVPATLPPTAAAVAEATTIWVTVPPLAAETAVPAAEIAALPPTPGSDAPVIVAENQEGAGGETAVSWLPYAGFLAIVLPLGLLVLRAGRRSGLS